MSTCAHRGPMCHVRHVHACFAWRPISIDHCALTDFEVFVLRRSRTSEQRLCELRSRCALGTALFSLKPILKRES